MIENVVLVWSRRLFIKMERRSRAVGGCMRTHALISVDADVAHSAGDAAVGPVDDVLVVDDVFLGQTEVDDVDRPLLLQRATSDDEVVRLDVAVDETPGMDQRKPVHLHNKQSQQNIWQNTVGQGCGSAAYIGRLCPKSVM